MKPYLQVVGLILALVCGLLLTGCDLSKGKAEPNLEPEGTERIVTQEEIQQEGERLTGLIESVAQQTVTQVKVEKIISGKLQTFSSKDPKTIQKWVSLLSKMETSPTTFQPLLGNGFLLTFYEGGEERIIGGFLFPYIYNSTKNTMNKIDNYEALKNEFEQALKMISPKLLD